MFRYGLENALDRSWTLFFWGDVWKGCLGPRDGIAKIQME